MKLTWLGHSWFLLESGGWRLLLDPYEKVRGLRDICTQAHEVLCSHQHFDHNYRAGVTLLPQTGESPFTVRKVPSFHDEQQGALLLIVEGGDLPR